MGLPSYPSDDPVSEQKTGATEQEVTSATDLGYVVGIVGWVLLISGIANGGFSLLTFRVIGVVVGLGSGYMGFIAVRAAKQLQVSAEKREVAPAHLTDALKTLHRYFLVQIFVTVIGVLLAVLMAIAERAR